MEASTLTPAAHASLTEAAALLNATAGFAFLPVFCTSERAAASALGVLRSNASFTAHAVAWPAPHGYNVDEVTVLQAANEDLATLLEHFDGAVALLPQGSTLVLNAASSVWDAVARLLPAQLNFRREPLRTKGLRLVLMWPVALREVLMSGAPDLWSMRLLSPWADEQLTDSTHAGLPGPEPSVLPASVAGYAPLSATQESRYSKWRAHRDLRESQLSANDALELVGDLYQRRRWHDALDLAEWLEGMLMLQAPTMEQQHALASSQNLLAVSRIAVGDRLGALAAAQRAAANFRQLMAVNPIAYEPALAMSLNNLANCLSEVGQREAALSPAQEAVGIYRRLAQANPSAYEPDLAMSLTNLANRLSEVGQRVAALAPAQEAVGIYRRLAQANPSAYEPDLAMSLTNLTNRLSEVGQREAALVPAQEAVGIYRRLTQANPSAHEPDLASSLNNLAIRLSEVGQREAALVPAQEAVGIRRRLAQANPSAYEPDLAGSLNNLANSLSEVGQREAALVPAQEAMGIRRRLAQANPSAYEPALASSLWTAMRCLAAAGATAQARASGEESLLLFTRLAMALPEAFAGRRDAVARELKALAPAQL